MHRQMEPAPSSWSELFESAKLRAKKTGGRKGREKLTSVKRTEVARVKAASKYVSEKLERMAFGMPYLNSIHPFYRELLLTIVDEDQYRQCLSRIRSVARIVRKVAAEAARRIAASASEEEVRRERGAFFGRLRSLLESLDECFKLVRGWQSEIRKLPSIDTGIPSVVIAGAPNVGKSSLLKAISRAKPEVKPYPFTTTSVIVGHLELDGTRVQVIDTPGLLDRPLSEKGPVERRAISALKHLAGVVVYLFDPTPTCGFTLDYQLAVYKSTRELCSGKPLLPVANKVDITTPSQASELIKMLGYDARDLIFISALKGICVDYLLAKLKEKIGLLQANSFNTWS